MGKNARGEEAIIHGCTCTHLVSEHLSFGCGGYSGLECMCPGIMSLVLPPKDETKPTVLQTDSVENCTCSHEVDDHLDDGCWGDHGNCICKGKRQFGDVGAPPPRRAGFVPIQEVIGSHQNHYGSAKFTLMGCSCRHFTLEHDVPGGGCSHMTGQFRCPCKGKLVDDSIGNKMEPKSYGQADADVPCCDCESVAEALVCTCSCHEEDRAVANALDVITQHDTKALIILQTNLEREKREKQTAEGKQILGRM